MAKTKGLMEHPAIQNEDFAWCRTLRHAWELGGPLTVENNGRELHYTVVCERCKTQRVDIMVLRGASMGQYVGRYYKHPKGYLLTGFGDARPSQAELRGIHFQNLLNSGERAVVNH